MNYIRKLMKDAGLIGLFSLDDGVQQFHQFAMAEEDRDVFAFDSPLGWTRFCVMPMGWTRSPYECVLGLNVIFACFGADRLWRYMDELLRMTLSREPSLLSTVRTSIWTWTSGSAVKRPTWFSRERRCNTPARR